MALDISDEQTDRYLSGQMDEPELRSFLAELDKFPEQKESLLSDKEAYDALKIVRRAKIRKKLKELDKKLISKRHLRTSFILFSVILLSIFLIWIIGC